MRSNPPNPGSKPFHPFDAPAAGTPGYRLLHEVNAGGARFERVILTRNRRVMASVGDGGRTLRLHEEFEGAPRAVLRALGRLFSSRSSSARAEAKAEVRNFLKARVTPLPPRSRARKPDHRPGDDRLLTRLQDEFAAVNAAYFSDALPPVPIRLSGRMRRRNGHFSIAPLEIAISRRLCERGADGEAERTLRHEMIHLWQYLQGRKPGHGGDFRRWAKRLGIRPRATRSVEWAEDCA